MLRYYKNFYTCVELFRKKITSTNFSKGTKILSTNIKNLFSKKEIKSSKNKNIRTAFVMRKRQKKNIQLLFINIHVFSILHNYSLFV